MKYLTQEEHKEYVKNLKSQGYSYPEVTTVTPGNSPYGKCKALLENVPNEVVDFFRGFNGSRF